MTFKSFIIGLLCSFGLPLLLIVVIPFISMQRTDAVSFNETDDGMDEVYQPRRNGRITDGAKIYAGNGCYVCHSQLIRPTYAGSDLWRDDWAGRKPTEDHPVDTRRETTEFDFQGESFAQIGVTRIGPDLSNVGHRIERYAKERGVSPEDWTFGHLHDSYRSEKTSASSCPSHKFLFTTAKVAGGDETQTVPKPAARALVSYLLSLKKDDKVPYSINYSRDKKRAIDQ